MLGGMLSGTTETPGLVFTRLNKKVKQIRGMAGIMSNYNKTKKIAEKLLNNKLCKCISKSKKKFTKT